MFVIKTKPLNNLVSVDKMGQWFDSYNEQSLHPIHPQRRNVGLGVVGRTKILY